MLPRPSIVSFIQLTRPDQYSLPTRTIGNLVILPVANNRVFPGNCGGNPGSIADGPPLHGCYVGQRIAGQ
jgi:hypothetical protein